MALSVRLSEGRSELRWAVAHAACVRVGCGDVQSVAEAL